MPDKVIDIPGVGSVAFPDSMSDMEINAASTRLYKQSNPDQKQPPVKSWIDTAVDWLPQAGAAVGTAVGASTAIPTFGLSGVPGAIAGGAVGGAAGEAAKQTINRMRGQEAPQTSTEAATDIGKQALLGGAVPAVASSMVNPVVGKALSKIGFALEKAGAAKAATAVTRGGGLVELMRGDPKSAAIIAGAPYAATAAGKGLQAAGRAMTGAPNEIGMVQELYDAATHPSNPIPLSSWEASFLSSVADQIANMGRKLSIPQREVLMKLYATKLP